MTPPDTWNDDDDMGALDGAAAAPKDSDDRASVDAPPPVAAAKPENPIKIDRAGAISRPLPKVKTVDEARRANAEKAGDDTLGGEDAEKALMAYNAKVLERHAKVVAAFAKVDDAINPTKAEDYTKFLRAELSLINMRFAFLGVFTPPPKQNPEDVTVGAPEGLDPRLGAMRSVQMAHGDGADLTGD